MPNFRGSRFATGCARDAANTAVPSSTPSTLRATVADPLVVNVSSIKTLSFMNRLQDVRPSHLAIDTSQPIMAGTRPIKRCFVTVGATASFTPLIKQILSQSFLETLAKHDYTELRIQYGKNGQKTFDDYLWLVPDNVKQRLGVSISGFDFRRDGLREEMMAAKRVFRKAKGKGGPVYDGVEGCVISHAGEWEDLRVMMRKEKADYARLWLDIGCS